jgi:integrase
MLTLLEEELRRDALRAGARLDVVSRQLGHASIATTANIYLHDADDSANEVAELLATVFDARGGNLGE